MSKSLDASHPNTDWCNIAGGASDMRGEEKMQKYISIKGAGKCWRFVDETGVTHRQLHQGIYFAKQAGVLSFNCDTSICLTAAVKGYGGFMRRCG